MTKEMFKKFIIILLQTAGILLVGVLFVWLASHFSKRPEVVVPSDIVISTVTCPSDIDSYSTSTTKKVTLLENKKSNGTNGVLKGYKVTIKRTGLTSDIACGYLMYQVSFAGKPIEQENMALNVKPTDSKLGGHIWPDEKSGSIITMFPNKTQVLMPLDKVTYDGTTKNPIKEINLSALLNVADEMEFEVALSADTSLGMLNLVQLGYKCVNKETRKITDECNLEVEKIVPFP